MPIAFHLRRVRPSAWPVRVLLLVVLLGIGCDARSGGGAPHRAAVPALRSDAHTLDRRAATRERVAAPEPIRVVLLGDSITEGWSQAGRTVYERELAPLGAANLGVAGDRTEQLLGRLADGDLDGIDPAVAVLLIGTNNLGRDPPDPVAAGIWANVDWLQRARPDARVLLLALLPRGESVDDPGRLAARAVNERLRAEADERGVRWVDAGAALLEADGRLTPRVSPDALHLSEEGYARLSRVLMPVLRAELDDR